MFNVLRLLSSHLSKSIYEVGVCHKVSRPPFTIAVGFGHGGVNLNNRLLPIRCLTQKTSLNPNSSRSSNRDDSDDSECFELFELWSEKYEKTYPSEEDKLYRFQLFKSRVHFKPPNKRFLHLLTKYHPNIVSPLPDRSSIQSSHPDPSIPGRVRLIESLLSCNANSNEMKEASNEDSEEAECFGKTYSSEEEKLHRFKLFMDRLDKFHRSNTSPDEHTGTITVTLKDEAIWYSLVDFFEQFKRLNKEYQKTYSSDEDKLADFYELFKLWYKEYYETSSEKNKFYWLKLLMDNYPFKLHNKSYESHVEGFPRSGRHPLYFMELFELWNKKCHTKEEEAKKFILRIPPTPRFMYLHNKKRSKN